jgi:hypothetical protein
LVSEIKEGIMVECPIWTKIENAVVLEIIENIENFCEKNKIKISEDKIRSIIKITTKEQFISKNNIKIAWFISDYYFTQIHNSIIYFSQILSEKRFIDEIKFFLKILIK